MKTLAEVEGSPAGGSVVKRVAPDMEHNLMNAQLDDDQPGNLGSHSAEPPKRCLKAALSLIAVLLVFVTLGVAAWTGHQPASVVQGEVEATAIKVVPKVVGRVQAVHVCKGDKVRKGQLLVSLENQDLQEKLEHARTAMELANAHNKIVRTACVEHICAQSNLWMKTKAVAEHAEQTLNRSQVMPTAQVISVQELKDMERNLDWARSSERAAKASFDLALALFGSEGELVAVTNDEQTTRRVAELEASVAELAITSPIDGAVQSQIIGQGELVSPDAPVVSIVDPQEVWVKFNLPEGLLSNVQRGTAFRVWVPALGNREVPVKVTHRKS